jgi:hypothetical protein
LERTRATLVRIIPRQFAVVVTENPHPGKEQRLCHHGPALWEKLKFSPVAAASFIAPGVVD